MMKVFKSKKKIKDGFLMEFKGKRIFSLLAIMVLLITSVLSTTPTVSAAGAHTLSFDVNGGDIATQPADQMLDAGDLAVEPTDPTRAGYTFAGWRTAPTGGALWFLPTITPMPANDVILYASWMPNPTVSVSFDVNGGDVATQPADQSIPAGGYATKPTDPTRTGYTFLGWSTVQDGSGGLWDFTTDTVPFQPSVTLYAQWTAVSATTYTLSFDVNGGDVTTQPADQMLGVGDLAVVPTDPTRAGYTFTGWRTAPTGGTLWFLPTITPMPANDVTLYASWMPNPAVSVSFDVNGGDVATQPADQSVPAGGYAIEPTQPTRAGYTFTGWSTVQDGSGALWNFTTDTIPFQPSVTLYAQWTAISATTYTLSFDVNGGDPTTQPADQTLGAGDLSTVVTAPTRKGYTFTGWNTAQDGSGTTWNFATTTMPDHDVTLYAQWKKDTTTGEGNENNGNGTPGNGNNPGESNSGGNGTVKPKPNPDMNGNKPTAPSTGDQTNLALYFALLLFSLGAVIIATRKAKVFSKKR